MKKLFFIFTAVIGIFLTAEIACRIALPKEAAGPAYMRFSNPHRQQSGFIPDDELFWKLKPDNPMWKVNAAGFRGPELPKEKEKGEYRVICLGDSCTFGLGAGGVDYDQTYPAIVGKSLYPSVLEKALVNDYPAKSYNSFRAVNLGCPGYTSYQGMKLLKKRIKNMKPDVVIAYFGINDGFEAVGYADKDQRPVDLGSDALDKSALYSYLTRLIVGAKQQVKSGRPLERVSLPDYHANLDEIAKISEKNGAKAYFIAPPYLEANGGLKCEEHRIHEPAIDIMPKLKKTADAGDPVIFPAPDNVHPMPAGHAAIARAIVDRLIQDMEWINRNP